MVPADPNRKRTILHVTECWAAGVDAAMQDYVRATPEIDHWLLAARRPGPDNRTDGVGLFRGVLNLPPGHIARIRAISRCFRVLDPDLVHAHSSFAGFYVRMCPSIPAGRIVYSPHCYAFERTDIGRRTRLTLLGAEALLARRTGTLAAVSPHEAELAARLRARQRVVYVPHLVPKQDHADRPLAAMSVGRIRPQKDPDFLAEAARLANASGSAIRWTWVGDGDRRSRSRLEEAGVEVTGWMSRDQVRRHLAGADVYVHTAAWEAGPPLSLLEAVGAGIPVIAREIPALRGFDLPVLVGTAQELAEATARMVDRSLRADVAARLRAIFSDHTQDTLAMSLHRSYTTEKARKAQGTGR
jgi:glycosyltransferase involved in cell wall biosynthesis